MKILHVDDHVLFVEGLKSAISAFTDEIMVVGATNAEEALRALGLHADIDLILIDLKMPHFDGLQFIECLNEKKIFVPFVVLSACDNPYEIRRVLLKGASGFIPKTHAIEEVLIAIKQAMNGEIVIPEAVKKRIEMLPANGPMYDADMTQVSYSVGERHMDVLKLMQNGHSNDEIAKKLGLSRNTIKTHVKTLFSLFGVNNRIECVNYAKKINLI